MTKYVYLLSDYQEHGSENILATLDRAKLPELFREWWSKNRDKTWDTKEIHDAAEENLLKVLKLDEMEKTLLITGGGKALESGWGGLTLDVVELS